MSSESKRFRTSYSRLSAYKQCPKRYKEEPRGLPSEVAEKGKIFHDAIKKVLLREGSIEEIRAWIAQETALIGVNTEGLQEILEMYDRITASKYYIPEPKDIISVESDDGETILHGEPGFEIDLPLVINNHRITLSGKMDVVIKDDYDDGILIRDWKTGFLDADEFQADYYALSAYLKYWKISPIKVQFVYTRRQFSPRPKVYTAADMPGILEHIAILSKAVIEDTEFKPRLNSNCKTCTLKTGCDVFMEAISKAPDVPEIDPENWSAIRRWKEHLENISKAAGGFLNEVKALESAYLDRHGEALDDSGKIMIKDKQVSKYNLPVKPVKELLSGYDINWEEAAQISSKGLDTVVQSAVVEGKITPVQAREIDSAIKGKKKKGGDYEVEPIRTVKSYRSVIKEKKEE